MPEQEEIRFQTQWTYDQKTDREVLSCYRYCAPLYWVLSLLLLLPPLFALGLSWKDPGCASTPLSVATWLLCFAALAFPRGSGKKGSIVYRRSLISNGGKPVTNQVTFYDSTFTIEHPASGSINRYGYDIVCGLWEADCKLMLRLPHHLYTLIDPEGLTGGSETELLDFLRQRCPGWKSKRVRTTTLGRIFRYTALAVTAIALLLSITHLPGIQRLTAPTIVQSYTPYTQIADTLETLGITGCTPDMLAELEALDTRPQNGADKAATLLYWMGAGDYDPETWEWIPTCSGVYWFDMEVFSLDTMYTDFLRGVSAASSGKLIFTDIQEDTSQVDWESGTGTQSVTFNWNGQPCRLEGTVESDWFDLRVADQLVTLLRQQGGKEQLYFAYDGGQGFLVFYGTSRWASDFETITGLPLQTHIG